MAQGSSIWQVDTDTAPARRGPNAAIVPLKWAHDARTGEPRHIHHPDIIQGSVDCQCPACDLSLTPVLAGQPLRRNPTAHFRHPKGAQKDDCTLVAARLAAIPHLQERGFIDLPRRRMSASATGFSGQGYEGWAEAPEERISIAGAVLHDHATALLTLDDGRELLVDLTGQRDAGSDGRARAIVTLSLSDPAIAMMSPDDIRARLRLLPDIRWCTHWNDQALHAAASAQARQTAHDAMDAWGDADEALFHRDLPPDLEPSIAQQWRRETLLHSEVKAILEQASKITTPGLDIEVTRYAPHEFSGEWEDNTLRIQWMTASTTLPLENTQLEQRRGSIIPDVICTLREPRPYLYGFTETWLDGAFEELIEDTHSSQQWPRTVLIEVTVTHGIDQEKLRRIRELNLPTLEIDIGSLGGRVTREGLRHLVVNETVGKRWIHHPTWRLRRHILEAELDQHPITVRFQERLAELRRPRRARDASMGMGLDLSGRRHRVPRRQYPHRQSPAGTPRGRPGACPAGKGQRALAAAHGGRGSPCRARLPRRRRPGDGGCRWHHFTAAVDPAQPGRRLCIRYGVPSAQRHHAKQTRLPAMAHAVPHGRQDL